MQRGSKWSVLFHLAVAVLLFSLPGLRLGVTDWHLPREPRLVFGALALAYLGAVALFSLRGRSGAAGLIDGLLISLAAFGAVTILVLALDYQAPRLAYFAAIVLGVAALTLAPLLARFMAPLSILAVIAAGVVVAIPATTKVVIRADAPMHRTDVAIGSSLYDVDLTWFKNAIPAGSKYNAFGSVAEFGDGSFLFADGDGNLFHVTLPAEADPQVQRLPTKVPLNIEGFDKASGESKAGQFFRIMDVRFLEKDGKLRVLASHHWWSDAKKCTVLRVSTLETTTAKFLSESEDKDWKDVFESTPCLPLQGTDWPFSGMEGGGRIRFLDDSTFILSIGDHGFNGVVYSTDYVSNPEASYGKTWKVHLDGRKPELFTIGHRNPQGLFIDPNGAVWETEHGPQGGDELNLLEAGLNYGWPHVTYGTDYNKHTWPRNPVQGQHTGYTMPVYVWLPSIGTSNLIRLRGDLFPLWKDDLIVSSLVGGEVFRIRLDGKRVVFAEPLKIGERVRDLIEDHTGRIIMWTDSRSIIEMRPSKSPLESVNNTAQDAPR